MKKTTRYARTSALPAIAAALALSSTPLFSQAASAQETPAQPTTPTTTTTTTTTDPAPVSAAPAPVLDTTTPATTDTATTPDVAAPVAKAKPRHVATAAKPVATHTVAQRTVTPTTHAAAPAAAAPAAAPAPAATPAATAPSQSAVTPVVDTSATAAKPAPTSAAKPSGGMDSTREMELGGGALALIALGAGAWALSRRRHDEDEVVYEDAYEPEADHVADEPVMAADAEPEPVAAQMPRHDTVEQPSIVAPAPSAFAWGKPDPATQAEDDGSDRKPGETWVERAYRGPSPANPSVSLKTRLRRAAFFDKREREVAAGTAEPVDTDAGLPDAMVDEQEREIA